MPQHKKSSRESSLRKTAEERLGKKPEKAPIPRDDDVPKIVHELEVHQTELEIQNEELRHSQEELTDSRNSFEELYDFAPVGYLTLDREGRILKANQTAAKMVGVERSNLTRRNKFSSLISPKNQDIWHKYRLELLEFRGKKTVCELDIIKADKSLLSVILETICTLSPEKKEPLLMMAMIDITERKKAEEALRESEEKFRQFTDASFEGLVVHADGLILDVNKRVTEMLGYKPADLVGKTFWKYVDSKYHDMVKENIREGISTLYEAEIIHIDGRRVPVEVMGRSIIWQGRQVRVTAFRDITVRKQAEEALRESEEKYRNLYETALVGLFQTKISDGKILKANLAAAKILNYEDPEKLVQDEITVSKYYSAERRAQLLEELKKNGKVSNFDAHWKLPDGRELDISISATIFPEAGYLEGAVVDITERKQAEEALRVAYENLQTQSEEVRLANDALNKANKELERFAYVSSHDLQEPLRMVTSFTQLLEKRLKGKLDEESLEYLTFIVDGAKRMQQLIEDLLQFSRIGRTDSESCLIDCNDILDKVNLILSTAIDDTGAEVTHDDLPVLNANETTLMQLFQNLIGNAIKFHKKHESPRVHISARRDTGNWIFSVKDNGIGIKQKYFEKIFVIFQRLNDREEYSGTGIGLAVSKKIVELYGGKIWVESTEGEGTTFYFTFPI